MENQVVIFELGSESFDVDIAKVESIIKIQPITQLLHAPGFVDGVTNLRGKVLPVINLRKRFELTSREADKDSRIIVVSDNQTEVGMIVDEVTEVLTVPEGAVATTPAIAATVDSAFIRGIATLGSNGNSAHQEERLFILLALDKVLSKGELVSTQTL